MPVTYKKIASVTVGAGGATNIEFTNIESTYTDLILLASLRTNHTTVGVGGRLTFNNSATGYSERLLYGTGSVAASANNSGAYIIWSVDGNGTGSTANTFSNVEIYIPNYAGSTNKLISSNLIVENNATAATIYANAGLWSNTAAITSIKITADNGSYIQHSTATLYGISKS